jgi:protein-S-isoprenylcysteine O-methyltransferase Ste14
MMPVARLLIPALWGVWALVWIVMALRVKAVAWRESTWSRLVGLVPLVLAFWLLAARSMPGWLGQRWAEPSWILIGLGLTLVAAGLLLAVWARTALAGNWSGSVTLKEGHEIVRSGPYRLIRHPIYSGLLLAWASSRRARDRPIAVEDPSRGAAPGRALRCRIRGIQAYELGDDSLRVLKV